MSKNTSQRRRISTLTKSGIKVYDTSNSEEENAKLRKIQTFEKEFGIEKIKVLAEKVRIF